MINNNLDVPQRQAPLGVVIIFLQNVKRWARVLVFGIIPFLRGKDSGLPFWMFWVFAAVVLLLIIVFSYLQWKNFFFHISDGKFVIKQGVLKKEESLIPFDRIQSVQIKQNVVQQILKLAALQIDTAGSAKKEVQISALNLAFAEELKDQLMALKANEKIEINEEEETPKVEENVLMRFSLSDLMKVGLTENHLQSAAILLSLFFGFSNQFSELFNYDEESIYQTVFQFILVVLPIFVIVFFIVSILVSMWKVFIRYFNLSVILKQTGLSVKSGLFKIEENFVPVEKIQIIKWQSNPLRKLIGFKSLAIYQAASSEVKKKKAVRVPGCKEDQQAAINAAFYPEFNNKDAFYSLRPNGFWQVRLYLFFIVVPLAFLPVALYFENYIALSLLVLYCLLAMFFVHKYVTRFKANISESLLTINRGYVFPETVLLKLYKVQNVTVAQSIFQKRRGLITLKIYTASGNVTIPFIDETHGFGLANFLLYSVESSEKSWM